MTITISEDELQRISSELRATYGDTAPQEIADISKLTYCDHLAIMTMILGVHSGEGPSGALRSAIATCLYLGCLIGRAQATRELIDQTLSPYDTNTKPGGNA